MYHFLATVQVRTRPTQNGFGVVVCSLKSAVGRSLLRSIGELRIQSIPCPLC
jgi:hypothetical protein